MDFPKQLMVESDANLFEEFFGTRFDEVTVRFSNKSVAHQVRGVSDLEEIKISPVVVGMRRVERLRMVAHELALVVQRRHRRSMAKPMSGMPISDEDLEKQADLVAAIFVSPLSSFEERTALVQKLLSRTPTGKDHAA